jgi:hypothetical protein
MVGSPPEKTTPLMNGDEVLIISAISSTSLRSLPVWIASFWQYEQRRGHPRKNIVQADVPRQSTVESGTKPPKFRWILFTVRIILLPGLFECIAPGLLPVLFSWFLHRMVSAPDSTRSGDNQIHTDIHTDIICWKKMAKKVRGFWEVIRT